MRSLSLRYRVPLTVSLVVLATGLCLTAVVLAHDFRALKADAADSANQLASSLGHALVLEMETEDRWAAYRTLKAVFHAPGSSWLLPEFALVLDTVGSTFVASEPRRFPIALPPSELRMEIQDLLRHGGVGEATGGALETRDRIYHVTRVEHGGADLGTLLLAFSKERLWPRFYESAQRALLATVAILLVLLPVGWRLGSRLAEPLIELEACVATLGDTTGTADPLPEGRRLDELGRLRGRIQRLAVELREKQAIERQMLRNERQVALGRLAASVAHEINNPLGGMLTAIRTFRRHGHDEQVAETTLSLIERGLDQIRHIVSALLVEVKAEPRNLAPRDIADVLDLITPEARKKAVALDCASTLDTEVPVLAGPVRQAMLNLGLNAIRAAPAGGRVRVAVAAALERLTIAVGNQGEPIPAHRLEHLFEPFGASTWGGAGLGLWITDQTVRQLGGTISVHSEATETVFEITLPLDKAS